MAHSSRTPSVLLIVVITGLLTQCSAGTESPKSKSVGSSLYHRDHDHLWNRVQNALLIRTGPDERDYGHDRLEPLLWSESDHLLKGKSADRAVAVLEEFLLRKGESLIDDPLKSAILQRDLWLVANWAAANSSVDSKKLRELLARVIRRLALTSDQVVKLPDNYAQAVASKRFAERFDPDKPGQSYLPPDLFRADGTWVCVGRKEGPTAPLHLQTGNPFNNSTFLIFLKLPAGRDVTLDFLKRLAAFDQPLYVPNSDVKTKQSYLNLPNPALPQWPKGTEVALVRRALLIESNGRVVPSPITESVQIREMRVETPALTATVLADLERGLFSGVVNGDEPPKTPNRAVDAQAFTEFQLRRADLFAGVAGGLRDVSSERDFKTGFNAHQWDEFAKNGSPASTAGSFPERSQPFKNNRASCIGCHRYPGVYGFNSYHGEFPLALQRQLRQENDDSEGYTPKFYALTVQSVEKVEQAAVKWKEEQPGWKALKQMLPK